MAQSISDLLKEKKHDFVGSEDLQPLIDQIKDKKVVMLGEASHGTHEYYNWRARISKILLEEHDFDFVAVEGDWPPCYELNRYVKNYENAGRNTADILNKFERWPTWMWANWEVEEYAEWLKEYNSSLEANRRKGFYGLDVYSLWESMEAIIYYLEKEDSEGLVTARKAMRCFEPHREGNGHSYGHSTYLVPEGCRQEVAKMLAEIQMKTPIYNSDKEHVFSTEQNALVARNAEKYYRIMVQGGSSTWNIRDQHMMDTLDRLLKFHGENAKGIVWAHNTHIGDASYTDMADDGLFSLGELGRKKYGQDKVSLVGFGSYMGTVLAGNTWGADVELMDLPMGRPGSWEEMCHLAGRQFFVFSEDLRHHPELQGRVPHRAVGVVYQPTRERYGNYVPSVIPKRYDAFVFFNKSRALSALKVKGREDEVPDTYPFGI